MPSTHITKVIFTCLPRGTVNGTQARITVFVSPRLEDADGARPQLSDFLLGDWPSVIAGLPTTLMIDRVAVQGTRASPRPNEDLDVQLWRDLFPGTRRVKPFAPDDITLRGITSYPAGQVVKDLQSLYGHVTAQTGGTIGSAPQTGAVMSSHLTTALSDLQTISRALFPADGVLLEAPAIDTMLSGLGGDRATRAKAIYAANQFHDRGAAPPPPPSAPLAQPELDFHQIVAGLADHPTLLYRLGLAFDVLFPASALHTGGSIQFTGTWRGTSPLDVRPRTQYLVEESKFLIASETGDVDRGYVPLGVVDADGPVYTVHQLDCDGGAIQLVDYATTVQEAAGNTRNTPSVDASLPTLRTAGISITHRGRADWLGEQWTRMTDCEDIATGRVVRPGKAGDFDPDIYAEHALRGWRVDVSMDGGPWRSLCERSGHAVVAGRSIDLPMGEGYVKVASGTTGGASDAMYLHETIAGWDGWSLVARRPGRTLRYDPVLRRDVVVDDANTPGSGLDLRAEYTARPGSLPRLRYGHDYRLRVRAVDLAGGSVDKDDTDATHASTLITYRRYEPVPPPQLVPQRAYNEAESLENLAIRSLEPGETCVSVTCALSTTCPDQCTHQPNATTTSCVRHVLPPKGALDLAERHGKLDGAFGPDAPASLWYQVAQKEKGTLHDATYIALESGTIEATGLVMQQPPSAIAGGPAASLPANGAAPAAGQYVTHPGDEVPLPYLPDPLAIGVALWDHESGGGQTLPYASRRVPLSDALSDWPVKRSARIELVPASDDQLHPPQLVGGVLRCPVGRGRKMTLRYSSLPDPDVNQYALHQHAVELGGASVGLGGKLASGTHPAITPSRELTLVHAVQKPVTAPELPVLTVSRLAAETSVRFDGNVAVHGWSTSHVDVRADWKEWVEDETVETGIRLETHSAEVGRLSIADGATGAPLLYQAAAVQRTPPSSGGGMWSAEIYPEEGQLQRPMRLELGDTRHRTLACTAVGTSRYQEYFPPELIAKPHWLEKTGAPVVRSVASTARPPAPKVLYAVPTFKWEGSTPTPMRRGKGLRLYLDRPWFQTGEGERLAVVCLDSGSVSVPVSAWGADPIWSANPPTTILQSAIVAGNETATYGVPPDLMTVPRVMIATRTEQQLTGGSGGSVTLIGYVPEWHPDRKLWFVDIELETGLAYWPFVRLAVARWQPDTCSGTMDLSQVVPVEFVQVAPDRAASVVRAVGTDRVDIWLTGLTAGNALEPLAVRTGPAQIQIGKGLPVHPNTLAAGHRVYARLENRPNGGGELAWTTVGTPKELTARVSGDEVKWSGSIYGRGDTGEWRVVLTESEVHASDTGTAHDPYPYNAKSRERITYIAQVPV
jgi:hypothetical protein